MAQLPEVEANMEVLSFREPVGDNVVQDQKYVEYNHSISPNKDLTRVANGEGSARCLIEMFCPFCTLLVPLQRVIAQNVITEEE